MPIGTFLLRRGDVWSFRCRVPRKLAGRVRSKDVVQALRTGNVRIARFLAAAMAARIDGLWSDVEMAAENEVGRLIREWFVRELEWAWGQFNAGAAVRSVTGGVEDPNERRVRQLFALSELADHRLEDLGTAYRVGDYSAGMGPARAVVRELDAPIGERDRRLP